MICSAVEWWISTCTTILFWSMLGPFYSMHRLTCTLGWFRFWFELFSWFFKYSCNPWCKLQSLTLILNITIFRLRLQFIQPDLKLLSLLCFDVDFFCWVVYWLKGFICPWYLMSRIYTGLATRWAYYNPAYICFFFQPFLLGILLFWYVPFWIYVVLFFQQLIGFGRHCLSLTIFLESMRLLCLVVDLNSEKLLMKLESVETMVVFTMVKFVVWFGAGLAPPYSTGVLLASLHTCP